MTKKEFYNKYCRMCGTQRCGGPDDENFRDGCPFYRKEILKKTGQKHIIDFIKNL